MSVWTLLAVTPVLAFLAYRHPESMLQYLPPWLRPAQQDVTGPSPTGDRSNVADQPELKVSHDQSSDDDAEGTPKATATVPKTAVPTLALDGGDSDLVVNKASSAMEMPPPPRPKIEPATTAKRGSGLMPPPSEARLAPPASPASGLRVPSTGPLPNRGPPANSQQRVNGGGLSVNGVVAAPNPRGKVLLSPGHSPMDWAALTRRENLSGVTTFQRVTPSKLKSMTGRKGKPAWSSWQGKVYNITPYLDFHPGGKAELMKAAGRDGTNLFMDVHPWVNWDNMLGSCMVGVMVPESAGAVEEEEGLEALD